MTPNLNNLRHALYDHCTDNDCELHNPDVAMEEEVITLTELSFFIAGMSMPIYRQDTIREWARNVYEEQLKEPSGRS